MKEIVGLLTKVKVRGKNTVETIGKFDTGARSTSVDRDVAIEAGLKLIEKTRVYKSGLGKHRRFLAKAIITINGKSFETTVNISDRSHSLAKVLIGRDIILGNFIIDVSRTNYGPSEKQVLKKFIV